MIARGFVIRSISAACGAALPGMLCQRSISGKHFQVRIRRSQAAPAVSAKDISI